ncbi:MAG: hypothetical protein JW917_06550 [Ignavibacteria bacterium]|nr:hypothetical protein [Ignavibacteria bacterium]
MSKKGLGKTDIEKVRIPKILLITGYFILNSVLNILIAQSGFSFSGYSEDLPIYQYYKDNLPDLYNSDRNIFLNLTKTRLRASTNLWENSRINAEYEIDMLYRGSGSEITGDNSIINSNRQLIELTWKLVDKKNFSLINYIDRLYLKQDFGNFTIVAGRQRISWGTGRIWNPTDLFNPINPAFYYVTEKTGADAVSFKYAFANFTDLNIVFNPQEKIRNSNYGFRFRTNYHYYDLSLMGGYFDKRVIAGLDFAGNLFDAGIRGEGIISAKNDDLKDNFIKFIIGIDNQFTSKLYVLIEYHYNGEGKNEKDLYEFTRLYKGEIQNIAKNYICLSANYQVFPLLFVTLTEISNLNDESGFLNISASLSATENLTTGLGFQFAYGKEKSEYYYYPHSLYLQCKYHF